MSKLGPIGRLGRYTATHFRVVLIAWLLIAVVLGFFAPRVETALSGAGWETTGSQSVQARQLIDKNFKGLSSYGLMTVLYSPTKTVSDSSFQAAISNVERTLRADRAVSTVVPPAAGVSVSRDGHNAIVQAGAARDSNAMVVAADGLKGKLSALAAAGVQVHLTGASAMWSDFNAASRSAVDADDGRADGRGRVLVPRDQGVAGLDLGDELRVDVRARARDRLRPVHSAPLPRRVLRIQALSRGGHGGHNGHRRQSRPVLRRDGADLTLGGDARP
jgi:hypothetical protein